jgi:hypothetical protein
VGKDPTPLEGASLDHWAVREVSESLPSQVLSRISHMS